MGSISVSEKSAFIRLDDGSLVIQVYSITPNTIDLLLDDTFVNMFQYLSRQFVLVSYILQKGVLSLILGTKCSEHRPDFESLTQYFETHMTYIVPNNLDFNRLSCYEINFLDGSETTWEYGIEFHQKYINYYSLSELSITNFHSKIFKLLLEMGNLSIKLAFSALSDTVYCTVGLQATSKAELREMEEMLIDSLKMSPFLSGNFTILSKKWILKNPGKVSIGITTRPIEPEEFLGFLSLIPGSITSAKPKKDRKAFPIVKQQQLEESRGNDTSSKTSVNMKPTLELNDFLSKHNWTISTPELPNSPIRILNKQFEVELLPYPPENSNQFQNPIQVYSRDLLENSEVNS